MFALAPRVLMPAEIPPGPAVEPAFLYVRDVVGDEVVAQRVALIYRTPQLAGLRTHCNSAPSITNAVGIYAKMAIHRIAHKTVCAILLSGRSVRIVDVRARAHSDKQFLAVSRKVNRPRPVPASARQIGDMLRRSARLQISIAIREANHFSGAAHIQPLRVRSRRIKSQSIRTFQAACEDGRLLRLAVAGDSPEDADAAGVTFGKKYVAVGCCAQCPGIVESRGIQLNLESGQRHRPNVFRPRH